MTTTALRLFEVSLREARLDFHVIAPNPDLILAATVPAWGMRPQGPWPDGTEVVTTGDRFPGTGAASTGSVSSLRTAATGDGFLGAGGVAPTSST